jgi:lysophospholipase L1-like esterase
LNTTWRTRIAVGLLVLGLLLSIALNAGMFLLVRQRLILEQRLRLDPTGAARFVPANDRLDRTSPARPRVLLFGDSRIERWSPPLQIAGAEVVNRGWAGETTAQALLRLERDVLALEPACVVIQYGINDLKALGLLAGQDRAIVAGCAARLGEIVARVRERGIPVVLLTIFPVGRVPLARRPFWSEGTRAAVAEVNRRLRALEGDGVSVLDCDPVLSVAGRMRPGYAADEFHLTAAAYAALDAFLEPILAARLQAGARAADGPR